MIKVTTDAGHLAAEFSTKSTLLDGQFAAITKRSGKLLERSVKSHAPRQSGRYARSWRTTFRTFPGVGFYVSTSGTDEPYGYRLEEGFMEPDSLGKPMSQPPQPHVEPALAEVGPAFVGELESAVRVWLAMQPR